MEDSRFERRGRGSSITGCDRFQQPRLDLPEVLADRDRCEIEVPPVEQLVEINGDESAAAD